MADANLITILDACRLFASLDDARRQQLQAIAKVLHFSRDAFLFREGDTPPGIFVIGQGQVRVFKTAPNGKEHVLHLAGPGSTIAEVAVIEEIGCPANAEALEDSTCVLLPATDFRRLLKEDPEFSRELLPGMAGWVRHFVSLLEDIVLRDAAGRLANHLLGAPERDGVVVLPRSRKQLALHLNLTPETLSRVLRRLQDGHLLTMDGSHLRLRDRQGLRAVADGLFPRM